MPAVRKFIRHSSPNGLRDYFDHQGIEILDIDWDQESSTVIKQVLRSVENLSKDQMARLKVDAERVGQMTDELGQQSLLAMVKDKASFKALASHYDRSRWVYLKEPVTFRHAEDVRYADRYRGKDRSWRPFDAPKGRPIASDGKSLSCFKQKIHEHFQLGEKVLIEMFERTRTDRDGQDHELVQVMIYQEGLPHSDLVIEGEDLVSSIRRPVREQALTYAPSTGVLEVVASTKEHRAFIAEAFADVLLNTPRSIQALPVRRFDLSVLRQARHFDTDPDDRIAEVKVLMMRMQSEKQKGKIVLDVPSNSTLSLYEYASQELGQNNPLKSAAYTATQAKLWIRFHPDPGSTKGKRLPVGITYPDGCDLSRRTEKERLIRDKYLKRWGLIQDAL